MSERLASTFRKTQYMPAQIQLMVRLNKEDIAYWSEYQIQTEMVNSEGFRKSYYADIFIKPNIWIEIDGSIHKKNGPAKKDRKKDEWLEAHDYIVLRFSNDQVKKQLDWVISEISRAIRYKVPMK